MRAIWRLTWKTAPSIKWLLSSVWSRPVSTIQRTITNGFGDMHGADSFGAFEIGDCAAYFQNAIVGARGETDTLHCGFQQAFAGGIDPAMSANHARSHC